MTARIARGPTFYVCLIARLLRERRHIVVGANSPIPASAALLARIVSGGTATVSILGSRRHNSFTGLNDLFDSASLGRMDAFFLTPGQIDGQANINMVGAGAYPRFDVRWPGSHGSPLLYMMIPNIILFREEHSRRVLVQKVDFISAPGLSPPNVKRPGGPTALVTERASFSFDREAGQFCLESVHQDQTLDDIVNNTGFEFCRQSRVAVTQNPDSDMVRLISAEVCPEVAEIYPHFAERLRTDAETWLTQAPEAVPPPAAAPLAGSESVS